VVTVARAELERPTKPTKSTVLFPLPVPQVLKPVPCHALENAIGNDPKAIENLSPGWRRATFRGVYRHNATGWPMIGPALARLPS
jgi:hypothetical protein